MPEEYNLPYQQLAALVEAQLEVFDEQVKIARRQLGELRTNHIKSGMVLYEEVKK